MAAMASISRTRMWVFRPFDCDRSDPAAASDDEVHFRTGLGAQVMEVEPRLRFPVSLT